MMPVSYLVKPVMLRPRNHPHLLLEPQLLEPQLLEPQLLEPQLPEPQLLEPQLPEPQLQQLDQPHITEGNHRFQNHVRI